jgi:hypothetical protein
VNVRVEAEHAEPIAGEAKIIDLMAYRLTGKKMEAEAPSEELLRKQLKRAYDALRETERVNDFETVQC